MLHEGVPGSMTRSFMTSWTIGIPMAQSFGKNQSGFNQMRLPDLRNTQWQMMLCLSIATSSFDHLYAMKRLG